MNTTITAVATGSGRGAIAIIRVSGPKCLDIYWQLVKTPQTPQTPQTPRPNTIKPSWIYNSRGDKIDHVMMVYFKSPHSFTGEDMLEIHCHGSQAVISQILATLTSLGAKPAKPGEFSERAYYNGKIDITQAEAIMELVSSENIQTAQLATRQLAGEFSAQINAIKEKIVLLNATVSADIDFSEEDLPTITKQSIKKQLKTIIGSINTLLANTELLPRLKNGVHVAFVGLPNAGKSTLLNSLLGFERSIVTEIAGTTRDTVSENVEINGVNYHFIDTAGLNSNPDPVEAIGIERSIQTIGSADVVVLLTEPSKLKQTTQFLQDNHLEDLVDQPKTILVYTKSDIKTPPNNQLSISAKNNTGIKELLGKIEEIGSVKNIGDINVLTERQVGILKQVELILVNLVDNMQSIENDVIGAELEASIDQLNELTGEQANQQIIDSIFRSFCIGK